MFKKLNIIFYILLWSTFVFATPSNQISIPNNFSPNTTISSSSVNSNFNEIQTKFNNHTHTDITQLGVVTIGTWAATPVQTAYVAQGAGAITGEVRMWAGTTGNIPTGWLACDGSAVSRTTYSALFAIISTNYGIGDGSTTFNLPGWNSGKFVKGSSTAGTSGGADTSTSTGTTDSHTLTLGEIPSHTHDILRSTSGAGASLVSTGVGTTTSGSTEAAGGGGGHTHTFTSSSFSIVPTNQTAIMIIKT